MRVFGRTPGSAGTFVPLSSAGVVPTTIAPTYAARSSAFSPTRRYGVRSPAVIGRVAICWASSPPSTVTIVPVA